MTGAPLLARIDSELGNGPRSWVDVVVVRNVGPLLTSVPLVGDNISNRGFNAVVFAPRSGPTHFLKVRPKTHELFAREAAITVRLSEHEGTRELVSRSRAFSEGPAHVLAEEFVEGVALDVVMQSRHAESWHALAAQVLRVCAPMWTAINEVAGESVVRAVDFAALLADLELLELLGLNAAASCMLATRIRAAALPARLQHGDFWPRNVLKVGSGWRVLDFEACGEIVLPLYDIFHFIRGCGEAASGGKGNWIVNWVAAGAAATPLVDEVRRAAGSLDLASIEAALVSYLVEFPARLHRRGVARARIEGRVRELNALPDLLERGVVQRLLG